MDISDTDALKKLPWDLIDRLNDAAREAMYSHWNALLTVNGILIGVLSVLAAFGKVERYLLLAFFSSCVVLSVLLIWNFISFQVMYDELLKKLLGINPVPTPADREQRIKQRQRESGWRFKRTSIAQFLLLAETVILFFVIYEL